MWSVIAHGGAKEIPPEKEEANRKGMARALEAGCRTMRCTQDALEAVIATVKALEDDPTFNAGKGGAKRKDGTVELCGSVMTGHLLRLRQVDAIRLAPGGLRGGHRFCRLRFCLSVSHVGATPADVALLPHHLADLS